MYDFEIYLMNYSSEEEGIFETEDISPYDYENLDQIAFDYFVNVDLDLFTNIIVYNNSEIPTYLISVFNALSSLNYNGMILVGYYDSESNQYSYQTVNLIAKGD